MWSMMTNQGEPVGGKEQSDHRFHTFVCTEQVDDPCDVLISGHIRSYTTQLTGMHSDMGSLVWQDCFIMVLGVPGRKGLSGRPSILIRPLRANWVRLLAPGHDRGLGVASNIGNAQVGTPSSHFLPQSSLHKYTCTCRLLKTKSPLKTWKRATWTVLTTLWYLSGGSYPTNGKSGRDCSFSSTRCR